MEVLNSGNYPDAVTDGVCVVLVYATWCGPCRVAAGTLRTFENSPGVKICKINLEENQEFCLCLGLGVAALPTVLFYKNGRIEKKLVGLEPQEVVASVLEELKSL